MLHEAMRPRAGGDDREERDDGQAGRDVELPVAVEPPCTRRFTNECSSRVQHVVVEQPEHFEDRNEPDDVRRRG